MKRRNILLGMAVLGMVFTSCKNEKQEAADKSVDWQTTYVDSVSNIGVDEAKANWADIEAAYQQRTMEAEAALMDAKDQEKAKEKIEASKMKYEEFKARIVASATAADTASTAGGAMDATRSQSLLDSFFGAGKVGKDLNFSWVNKDNALATYQNFWDIFDKNHESYSREDLDQIKTIYEALDSRKNTVEKEGLSGEDNRKIAAIKLKFAPKFKWERITAKGAENKEAKEKGGK